jgi:hypothetical protein
MTRTGLIRLGGLAAMVGGALYALQSLRIWPSHQENVFFLFLVLGAMAAIAAIAALAIQEGGHWKLPWMVGASLVAFVGVALILVYALAWLADQDTLPVVGTLLFVGLLVSTLGLLVLGVVAIRFGVLPWWGGAALIVGSPLLALLLRLLLLRFPVDLTGVVWAVVGYAIFRAATQHNQQPARVQ